MLLSTLFLEERVPHNFLVLFGGLELIQQVFRQHLGYFSFGQQKYILAVTLAG